MNSNWEEMLERLHKKIDIILKMHHIGIICYADMY